MGISVNFNTIPHIIRKNNLKKKKKNPERQNNKTSGRKLSEYLHYLGYTKTLKGHKEHLCKGKDR